MRKPQKPKEVMGEGPPQGQAAPGPLYKGARKHTLSAQLNKLCEIIKHDHLLLLSITSKSKLSEEEARSTRAPSAPIGREGADVGPGEPADWLSRSARTPEGEIIFKISWTCGSFFKRSAQNHDDV